VVVHLGGKTVKAGGLEIKVTNRMLALSCKCVLQRNGVIIQELNKGSETKELSLFKDIATGVLTFVLTNQ
jgi:hypothetical protein